MYIGIDIGGTNARVAAASTLENIRGFVKKEFKLTHSFDQDFSHLVETIKELAPGKVNAIGVGIPGDLNKTRTAFVSPENLTEWSDKPIQRMLTKAFSCRVILENDAVIAAIAEAFFGKGKGKDFTYLIWGTGIGGATAHWEKNRVSAVKLDWYQYFQSWESDCGGNEILKHLGKSADLLSEEEWQGVIKKFSIHFLEFCRKTNPTPVFFGGGIAVKQVDRLSNLINITALGEDAGLYGALYLLK